MRLSLCEKCGSPKENHRACAACGFYKGREAVNVMKRTEKRAAKSARANGRSSGEKQEKKEKKEAK